MMLTATLLALVVGGLGGADEPAENATDGLETLKGTYTIISYEYRTQKVPPGEGDRIIIEGDKLTEIRGRRAATTSTIRLDPSKQPRQIDILYDQGGRIAVSPGIYKLEGDTLTICLAFPGGARPERFEATGENSVRVMKRADP